MNIINISVTLVIVIVIAGFYIAAMSKYGSITGMAFQAQVRQKIGVISRSGALNIIEVYALNDLVDENNVGLAVSDKTKSNKAYLRISREEAKTLQSLLQRAITE